MLLVALTGLAATAGALVLYARLERAGAAGLPLAALRAAAWGTVAALLVDPGCRRSTGADVTVLLDASASMTDPGGESRWHAALDTARAVAGRRGRILLFGAEPAAHVEGARPDAATSRLLPALREGAARGGRLVVVTDGEIADALAVPSDLARSARILIVPRALARDAGIAGLDLPATLRAGDTAIASVDIATVGTRAGDSVTVELVEGERVAARARLALGGGGVVRRDLPFVPAPGGPEREVRRFEARLSGLAGDAEPRDDRRASAAAVSRASAITLVSDSPDWDFRWLAQALTATAGVPVRVYARVGPGVWREARTLRPVSPAQVRDEVRRAALVVAHGGDEAAALAREGRRAVWRWRAGGGLSGDWYVMAPEFASPVGGALAGVAAESLPPLESVTELPEDSVEWTGLTVQLERRGRSRPVVQGTVAGGRRGVQVGAAGFWRWASRGGLAGEGYRAFVAALTDWLLEEERAARADLVALRDSLDRSGREFLPRRPALAAQDGRAAALGSEPVPLRHASWVYFAALAALVGEWIARRRRGLW